MWIYEFLLWLDLKRILLFLFVVLLVADFLKNRNPPNFPPGPPAFPLVGNVFSFDAKQPHIYLTKLADVYGNVFCVRLGRDKTVFVSGYKIVKEALLTQAENFADRPFSPLASRIYTGNTGEAFDPVRLLNSAVSNIICQMVFGRRFDYSDDIFQTMLKYLAETIHLEGSIWAHLYDSFPGLMKHLPGPHNNIFSNYKFLEAFIRGEIEQHRMDLNPSNPRDYIDAFLVELENNKGNPDVGFHETNLVFCSLDLFFAGTETTSTTLLWALVFLIKHPHVQEEVQSEIDSVIGQFRQPTMADKANMPYTDAVIHEIQRMGNIVPLNGLRMAAVDTTLGGYFIPKGTTLMPNLTSVLFDKNEWETPDTFNPGHFLDADGKVVKRDAFLPFSAGKRACLGEGLAKTELFLFFVNLFQKFSFTTLDGVELSTEGKVGATRTPYPFKVYAKAR